jgi:bidirectional [NiFe] hydrogenase diaphorase subunit
MGTATATKTASVPNVPVAASQGDPRLNDKRYKLLEAAMRKHGYQSHALIESLHSAQESFGFLDDFTLRHIARSLKLPYSRVYGVATFYNYFTLKPAGEHACVICMGTACYIKGANKLLDSIEQKYGVKPGQTTPDKKFSILTARCFGSCAIAPAAVLDGESLGKQTPEMLLGRIDAAINKTPA